MKRLTRAELKRFQTDQLNYMQELTDELGSVATFKILWMTFCVVTEPSVIRELLIKHGDKLTRDPFVSDMFGRVMGNGVFVAEGELWKKQRKLMQPAFHAMRIQNYTDVMADYTREMVMGWEEGEELAIDEALTEVTLRIIAKTMYGVDLASKVTVIGERMKELLTIVEQQLHTSFVAPAWLPTPLNRRHGRALEAIKGVLREVVAERRAEGEDSGDLLSMLLQVRDETGEGMSEQQILDECITLFVAGHETTAATLTWTWHILTQNREIYARVREEVDTVLGKRPIAYTDIPQMPYLEAVIKETLRMYTPAPSFGRQVQEPFVIGEHSFTKGMNVFVSIHGLHHRADLYPEPEQFRPERFLDEEKMPDRYTYMPFGAGARICLGNMFAMLEAAVLLATMVQHIELDRVTTAPVELDTRVTVRPSEALLMRVRRRPVG